METKQAMFQIRIAAARDSLKRSRLIFFIATVVSLAILFAAWNAYISWYRDAAMRDDWSKNPVTQEAQKQLLSEWVKSRSISIAPLGIHIGISDGAPLASFSLLITTVWFFYTVRRSNHVIGALLIDSKDEDKITQAMIYHGVVSNLVFLDLTGDDEPISQLSDSQARENHDIPAVRGMIRFLAYLPALTIFFVVTMDILSIVTLKSPFRDPPHLPLVNYMTASEWVWVAVFEGAALMIGVSSAFLTARALEYERGSAKILKDYLDKMKGKSGQHGRNAKQPHPAEHAKHNIHASP
jgi:hypothetical protein